MILGEWKIQLTTAINLMSSKDSTETRTMHSTSDNIEIMIGSKTDETIVELFESLLQKYQKGLEQSMKEANLLLVALIYCNINVIK